MCILAPIYGSSLQQISKITSSYATWFTAIRIAHYDVNDDVTTRKL